MRPSAPPERRATWPEEASRTQDRVQSPTSATSCAQPLQSILGFSELGEARSGEQARLAAMFKEINGSGQRMLALVNDLLDRVEDRKHGGHLPPGAAGPAHTLLRDVAREFEPLLAPQQLQLDLKLSQAPLLAKVDPMRFQQVVRNVLANAVKFSPAARPHRALWRNHDGQRDPSACERPGPGHPAGRDRPGVRGFRAVDTHQGRLGWHGPRPRDLPQDPAGALAGASTHENLAAGGTAFHIHLPARGSSETSPVPL